MRLAPGSRAWATTSYALDLSGKSVAASRGRHSLAQRHRRFQRQNFTEKHQQHRRLLHSAPQAAPLALDNQFSYGDDLTWSARPPYQQIRRAAIPHAKQLLPEQLRRSARRASITAAHSRAIQRWVTRSAYDFADFLLTTPPATPFRCRQGTWACVNIVSASLRRMTSNHTDLTCQLRPALGIRPADVRSQQQTVRHKPTNGRSGDRRHERSSRSLYSPTWHDFDPRLGFAWNPDMLDKKLVLRGGVGVTSYMDYNLIHNHVGNAPFHIGSPQMRLPQRPDFRNALRSHQRIRYIRASTTGVSFNAWNNLKPMMEPQYSLVAEYAINSRQKRECRLRWQRGATPGRRTQHQPGDTGCHALERGFRHNDYIDANRERHHWHQLRPAL